MVLQPPGRPVVAGRCPKLFFDENIKKFLSGISIIWISEIIF